MPNQSDEDDLELSQLLRETARMTTDEVSAYFAKKEMFDPRLPGSLLAGHVICRVPDSDIKYASFLEWWFAVGRRLPKLTTEGWGATSGPQARTGCADMIPKEDWEQLSENERDAIGRWADGIEIVTHYD